MDTYQDFVESLQSVIKCSRELKDDVAILINKLFQISYKTIEKLKKEKRFGIVSKFMQTLEHKIGEYAGAMTDGEYYFLCEMANHNLLTIKHCRKCCNMFWAMCKIIFTSVIFEGVAETSAEILISDFMTNLDIGLYSFQQFFSDILDNDINTVLLQQTILEGFAGIEQNFGFDAERKITKELFYNHVIRMTFLEPRFNLTFVRDESISGYHPHKLSSVSDFILMHLTDEEISQTMPGEHFPWKGKSICGVKAGSEYAKFCFDNGIYSVSGMSGTTFELMLYMLILLNPTNKQTIISIMLFFLNFHVLRGTHSVLEVVLAFYHINNYIENDTLNDILSNVCANSCIQYSTLLCENLLLSDKKIESELLCSVQIM